MSAEEITKQIYEDIQDALAVIAGNIEHPGAAIQTINVKVGQKSDHIQDESDLSPDPLSPDNGWVIDIEFVPENLRRTPPTFKTRDTFGVFNNLSIKLVKGLGQTWQERFTERQVYTFNDLIKLSQTDLLNMVNQFNSFSPVEFHRKVSMLIAKIPISVIYPFEDETLEEVVFNNFDLSEILNNDAEIVQMASNFFNSCITALDKDALRAIKMHMFL